VANGEARQARAGEVRKTTMRVGPSVLRKGDASLADDGVGVCVFVSV
jgi:hypothetical protein